jgi:hypothetical protein
MKALRLCSEGIDRGGAGYPRVIGASPPSAMCRAVLESCVLCRKFGRSFTCLINLGV